MKEEKIKNTLKLEIYTKGGSQWYCDYYFYNGLGYEKGTTKAGGYGYDKHSTATSNAINKFKFLYKFKNGLQWDGRRYVNTKQGKRIYGVYEDKTISYGIGISSVMNCLNAFNNVKVVSVNYGQKFDYIHLEITTTQKAMQKELKRNQKILANKKADKYDKKEAKETIKRIKELFNI
jgi:hypothetical protein